MGASVEDDGLPAVVEQREALVGDVVGSHDELVILVESHTNV